MTGISPGFVNQSLAPRNRNPGFLYLCALGGTNLFIEDDCVVQKPVPNPASMVYASRLPPLSVPAVLEDFCDVVVSFVAGPSDIYVQLKNETATILKLCQDLKQFYMDNRKERNVLINPRRGDYCAAKYLLDGNFYRAAVLSRPNSRDVQVYFVDYGNTEIVSKEDILQLEGNTFLSVPPQAVKVSLHNVPNTFDNGKLTQIILSKEVAVKMMGQNCKDSFLVNMEFRVGNQDYNVNEIVRERQAPPVHPIDPSQSSDPRGGGQGYDGPGNFGQRGIGGGAGRQTPFGLSEQGQSSEAQRSGFNRQNSGGGGFRGRPERTEGAGFGGRPCAENSGGGGFAGKNTFGGRPQGQNGFGSSRTDGDGFGNRQRPERSDGFGFGGKSNFGGGPQRQKGFGSNRSDDAGLGVNQGFKNRPQRSEGIGFGGKSSFGGTKQGQIDFGNNPNKPDAKGQDGSNGFSAAISRGFGQNHNQKPTEGQPEIVRKDNSAQDSAPKENSNANAVSGNSDGSSVSKNIGANNEASGDFGPTEEDFLTAKQPVLTVIDIDSYQLTVAKVLDVEITYAVGPGSFFVRPKDWLGEAVVLEETLHEWSTKEHRPMNVVKVGKVGYAEFEGAMYRCAVSEVSRDKAKLFFFDYGNSEEIKKSEIFEMKMGKPRFIKRMCIPCQLQGVVPVDGAKWSEEAQALWDGMVEPEGDAIAIFDAFNESNGVYSIGLKVNERKDDVGMALKEAGLAKTGTPKSERDVLVELRTVKDQGLAETFSYWDPYPISCSTDKVPVEITFTDYGPSNFFVRPDYWDKDNSMINKLAIVWETESAGKVPLKSVTVGAVGYSKFDEGMYRCVVTEVAEEKATVLYVDYGNSETVDKSEIFELKEESGKSMRRLCVSCRLNGVKPLDGESWSEAGLEFWFEATDPMKGTVVFHSVDDSGVYSVTLTVGDVDFAKTFVEKGFATVSEPPEQIVSSSGEAGLEKEEQLTVLKPPARKIDSIPVTLGQWKQVEITFGDYGPGNFFLRLQDWNEEVQIIDDLAAGWEANPARIPLENVTEGSLGYAEFEDGMYRCSVTKVTEVNATVFFLDYGNSGEKLKDQIFQIEDGAYRSIGGLCVPCRLKSVVPIDGDSWTEEALTFWRQLTEPLTGTAIFHSRDEISGFYSVSLTVNEKDLGQALVSHAAAKLVQELDSISIPTMEHLETEVELSLLNEMINKVVLEEDEKN